MARKVNKIDGKALPAKMWAIERNWNKCILGSLFMTKKTASDRRRELKCPKNYRIVHVEVREATP